ncbi:MAG: methyltransferase, partial [Pseudomonadota bacterium]
LASKAPETVHHSACAALSARENLAANDLAPVAQHDWLQLPADRRYELVLMRMPKDIELLRAHCQRLRPQMTPGATLLCGVMDKYLSKSMLETLSAEIGPTHTTLGRRKSRLSVSRFDDFLTGSPPVPFRYPVEPFDLEVVSLPGVFAASRLDIGSRFLLEQFPKIPLAAAKRIADLGCGNGLLGLAVARSNTEAKVDFYDDSSLAIESARLGARENFGNAERFRFLQGDGLTGCPAGSLDLVLCNPPFHLGAQQDASIAERLFTQAFSALRTGGELWVVGNRHLGYHVKLQRLFERTETVAANRKFVVLKCRRS